MDTQKISSIGTLVDTHCHIDLQKDPVKAVMDAETNRIHTIAVTNAPSVFFHTRNLCDGKRFVHAALGLHPELIASHGHELDKFLHHINETRFVGEIGLDYVTTDQALKKRQREVLSFIVHQSQEAGGRIMTVHSRRAGHDAIELLSAGSKNSTILHWFSGTRKELELGIERGFFFSVNAAMLSSKNGISLLSAIPQERVLTETDAPFARIAGRASAPKDISQAVESLATCWKLSFDETIEIVSANFHGILQKHGLGA